MIFLKVLYNNKHIDSQYNYVHKITIVHVYCSLNSNVVQ